MGRRGPGFAPGTIQSHGSAIACDACGKGLLAPGYSERHLDSASTEEDERKAFDPKAPIPSTSTSTCPS